MKNRDQIRARNALAALDRTVEFKGAEKGDPLSGFPALVLNNGLLATLAFSQEKGGGYGKICDAIARHLADSEIGLLNKASQNLKGLLQHLTQGDSSELRLCTAESLAFLNYLRRFAKRRKEDSDAD